MADTVDNASRTPNQEQPWAELGLKADEYADILAYLLQVNGFPAGQESLVVEPATALDAIKITKKQ